MTQNSSVTNYLRLLRTEQYIKNFFVFAPVFFGGKLLVGDSFLHTALAFVCYCLAASSIYIVNDYFDIPEDQKHPVKCKRPLAAGVIKPKTAIAIMAVLVCTSLALAFYVSVNLLLVIAIYIVMNLLYSKWLKHITVLDVNIIAIGFVLRIIAGAIAADVRPSVWILLITYLLALFLGFGKRRADVLLSMDGKEVRKNIDGYNLTFIDTILSILASIIIVAYILYTISPEVQMHYKSDLLYLSIVFVINGLLYYMKLTLVDRSTDSPTMVVLKDRVIQITMLCWLVLMIYLLYFN